MALIERSSEALDLVEATRAQLEELLAQDIAVAHPAANGEIPKTEREMEIAKSALLKLKITQLRRIAESEQLPLLNDPETMATLIARRYNASREEIAELILKHRKDDPEAGYATHLLPLREPPDLGIATERLKRLTGNYLRLAVAHWLVFNDAPTAATEARGKVVRFSGEFRYLAARGAIAVSLDVGQSTSEEAALARQQVSTLQAEWGGLAGKPRLTVTETREPLQAHAAYTLSCEKKKKRWCNSLVGGDTIEDEKAICTLGYWVVIKGREPWVASDLTAGHCISGLPQASHITTCYPGGKVCTEEILSLTYYISYGRGDAGLLDNYSPPTEFPEYGGYWNWSIGTGSPLEAYYPTPAPPHTVVCHQGSTSGSDCGEVLHDDVEVSICYSEGTEECTDALTDSNMIEFEMKTCEGDSGGPIDSASSDTAVGITVAASIPAKAKCGKTTWGTPINEPVEYWNLQVVMGGY